ncbi:type IV pili methyl-accepting chemotaxis transducer N-terminal domain-containing protein, partial [Salinibacter ruber]
MSWFSGSLTAKVTAALSAMLLLLAGSMVAVYVQVQKQETDGLVINETGKLRMLSQRMAKSALTAGREDISSQERSEAREELRDVAQQFNDGLQAVYKGDPSRSIPPAPPAVAKQLSGVEALWQKTRSDIGQVLKAEPGSEASEEALAGIQSRNLDLLKEADAAVGLFEKQAEAKITSLYWILSVLMGLGALLFVGILVAMQRLLVAPVQQLDEAAQQVAAGDLETHVRSSSGDEVGQLAESFNQMVGQIKNAIQEAEAQEKQAQEAQDKAEEAQR